MADKDEKTEKPTARRKSEARRNGDVAVSQELSLVIGITAAFYALTNLASYLWEDLIFVFKGALNSQLFHRELTIQDVHMGYIAAVYYLLPHLLLLLGIAAFFGAGCTLLQTDFLWCRKLLQPKFKSIHPMAGFKRIFSKNNLVNIGKSLIKLSIILPVAYSQFMVLFPSIMGMSFVPLTEILPFTAVMASAVFKRIVALLFILAIFDVVWQRYRHYKGMKMTKNEVKDEKKAVEGDERTRRRIVQIGLKRAYDRMMQSVPSADVVVTNPTHYAVALSYKGESGSAPKVIAKGRGHVALRIREIAQQHGVPIVERKPLARALYASVEVGQEIPFDLYRAVAELLAYVYRIKGRRPERKAER